MANILLMISLFGVIISNRVVLHLTDKLSALFSHGNLTHWCALWPEIPLSELFCLSYIYRNHLRWNWLEKCDAKFQSISLLRTALKCIHYCEIHEENSDFGLGWNTLNIWLNKSIVILVSNFKVIMQPAFKDCTQNF